jgi:hypothetical protein
MCAHSPPYSTTFRQVILDNVQFHDTDTDFPVLYSSITVSHAVPYLCPSLTCLPEGTTEYTTCTGLLTESSMTWPNTSVFQIAEAGVTLDKLVIGKPATTADATNGYMNTSLLAECVDMAYEDGWGAFNISRAV